MSDIFISHADEEKALAGTVEGLLKEVLDPTPTVFLSSNIFTLVGGEPFEERIRSEIRGCKAFIALFSRSSFGRHWMHIESGAAWGLGKAVIPVCYGGQTVGGLPRPYSSLFAIDLLADPYRLVIAVAKVLEVLPPPPAGVHLTGPNWEKDFPHTGPYVPLGRELRKLRR